MSEAIVFTSGKGGVGKTTTIANIGTVLSQFDKKVIMLDTDMGLRNLDVVMGLEDQIRYNLIDVLEKKCRLKQAIIRDKRYPNLHMIPAALKFDHLHNYESDFKELIGQLKKEFDYCLIDCPAGIGSGYRLATVAVDRAIVITTPHISAVRDAGRIIYQLQKDKINDINLVINEYDERMVRHHDMLSKADIEELLGITSIGIIPADKKIIISQNKGTPVVSFRSKSTNRFIDIASYVDKEKAGALIE